MPGKYLSILLFSIAISFLAAGGAQAEKTRKIREWNVICGNDFACTMAYDSGAGTGFDGVGFQRSGAPNALVSLQISVPAKTPLRSDGKAHVEFAVDSKLVIDIPANQFAGPINGTTFTLRNEKKVTELLAAMRSGEAMQVVYRGQLGNYEVTVPLSGVTGALLFMDEAQNRLKRVDALQDKGDLPAPLGSPLEEISHVAELPDRIRADFESDDEGAECSVTDDRLAHTPGFILRYDEWMSFIVMPCNEPGAYNQPYAIYGGYGRNFARISFPVIDTNGPTIMSVAFNISYDAAKGELSSFYRGRGIGDCGITYRWRLQGVGALGQYLHLAEQRAKDSCDGNDLGGTRNWPTQWPRP